MWDLLISAAATAPGHEDHHHHDEGDAVMGVIFAPLLHIFHVLHLILPHDYLKSRYGPPVSPLQHYGDHTVKCNAYVNVFTR